MTAFASCAIALPPGSVRHTATNINLFNTAVSPVRPRHKLMSVILFWSSRMLKRGEAAPPTDEQVAPSRWNADRFEMLEAGRGDTEARRLFVAFIGACVRARRVRPAQEQRVFPNQSNLSVFLGAGFRPWANYRRRSQRQIRQLRLDSSNGLH